MSCILGMALVISMLMVAYAPIGYADVSYTATTTSASNSIESSYGVLTVSDGTSSYGLNEILKTQLTTSSGKYVKITREIQQIPDSVTFTFTFSNLTYKRSGGGGGGQSYTSFATATIVLNNEETSCSISNGSGSVDITLTRQQLQSAFTITDEQCTVSYSVKLQNTTSNRISTNNNAKVTVESSSGGYIGSSSAPSISGKNINSGSTGTYNGSFVYVGGMGYFLECHHTGVYNGSFSISITISEVDDVVGATIRITLGGISSQSTVSSAGVCTITYSGLSFVNNEFSERFTMEINHTRAVAVGDYAVTAIASLNGHTATNHADITTIPITDPDDAIDVINTTNPDLGEQGYELSEGTVSETGYSSVSITSEGQSGIADANGDIDLNLTIPSGVDFVFYMTNTRSNNAQITIHLLMKVDGITVTDEDYILSGSYTSRYISYKEPVWMYSINSVNQNDAWISGEYSNVTIEITGDDIDSRRALTLELVFRNSS